MLFTLFFVYAFHKYSSEYVNWEDCLQKQWLSSFNIHGKQILKSYLWVLESENWFWEFSFIQLSAKSLSHDLCVWWKLPEFLMLTISCS